MAFNLKSITKGITLRAPRIIVLGVEKIGKTCFGCGAQFSKKGVMTRVGINDPIVIPIRGEEGADGLDVPIFPTCQKYEDILEAIGSLYSEDHKYRTDVLDSASAAAMLINDDVCEEFDVTNIRKVPGFRTGEAAVLNRWRGILDGFDALRAEKNMSTIIIGHIRVKKMKNPSGDDYDMYDFDLDNGDVAELLKRWADVILFANTKVVVKKQGEDTKFSKAKRTAIDTTEGKRYLFTQKRPDHPGGGRGIYGQLPYELPLDWQEFENAVAAVAPAKSK